MRRRLLGIAVGLYMLSLFVPALAVHSKPLFGSGGHDEALLGMQCLAIGFFVWPGWIANPLVIVAWILIACADRRAGFFATARWLALLAIVSAVIAPFFLMSTKLTQLRYPHVGYFLWLASIVLTALEAHLSKLDADDARVS